VRGDLPRKVATKAFFGALDEMVTSWILGRKDYDLAQLADPVVELFLNGVAPRKMKDTRPALAAVAGRGVR